MAHEPPKIEGVAESILYVDDLARAIAFYRDVLGLAPAGGDQVRFQAFEAGPRQVLLLFLRGGTLNPIRLPGGVIPAHNGHGPHHLGFAIAATSYETWLERLKTLGVAIESEVAWSEKTRSIYFRDPDGNMLELVTPGLWPNY